MIRVVHVRKAPFTLYIGRAHAEFPESKWRNPYHKYRFGLFMCLRMFEDYVRNGPLWNDLWELDNQILGCWCSSECHGHVLRRLRQEQLDALRGTPISS